LKNHTKIYFKHFGYGIDDFIPCEICGNKAVDIHHIENRKIGGDKKKDNIENLMALCRECHLKYGDVPNEKENLKLIHLKKL
jgi:5-methylcytosine-specific restriction endonuclease McrA